MGQPSSRSDLGCARHVYLLEVVVSDDVEYRLAGRAP
jgi:hypothetical protein